VDSVQWIPLDFDGFQWTQSSGVQWIPLDFGGVHWIPLESVGVRKVLRNFMESYSILQIYSFGTCPYVYTAALTQIEVDGLVL